MNHDVDLPEYYVQFFCWDGEEPTPEAVISALRERGVQARRGEAFSDSVGEYGWRQSMLVGFLGEPVFIEIYRPDDRWEGTTQRGTFEGQVEDALQDATYDSELASHLLKTKFIVATNSARSDAARGVANLIGSAVRKRARFIVRVDGKLDRSASDVARHT